MESRSANCENAMLAGTNCEWIVMRLALKSIKEKISEVQEMNGIIGIEKVQRGPVLTMRADEIGKFVSLR